jgi:hypothetical protein
MSDRSDRDRLDAAHSGDSGPQSPNNWREAMFGGIGVIIGIDYIDNDVRSIVIRSQSAGALCLGLQGTKDACVFGETQYDGPSVEVLEIMMRKASAKDVLQETVLCVRPFGEGVCEIADILGTFAY